MSISYRQRISKLGQAKFTHSPLEKASQKQIKTIEQHKKQLAKINVLDKKDDFSTYDIGKDYYFLIKKFILKACYFETKRKKGK